MLSAATHAFLRHLPPLLLALTLAAPSAAVAQPPVAAPAGPPATGPAARPVTDAVWVEVLDAEGQPATGLRPGAFTVTEDGAPRPVAGLRPAGDWQIAIVFDETFTSTQRFRNGAADLALRARQLTDLGKVEVLTAGSEMETALPPTRDPAELEQVLSWLAVREVPEDAQAEVRRELLDGLASREETTAEAGRSRRRGEPTSTPADAAGITDALGEALRREASLVDRFEDLLVGWAAREPAAGPRLLLLVTEGFDADPAPFYRGALAGSLSEQELTAALGSAPRSRPLEPLGQVLSAYGWTVVPYLPAAVSSLSTKEQAEGAEKGEGGKELEAPDLRTESDETPVDLVGATRKLLGKKRQSAVEPAVALRLDPRAPLAALAAATGGALATDGAELTGLLGRLPARLRLTFQPGEAPPGQLRRLEVQAAAGTAGSGWTLRSRRWTVRGTPEAVLEVRARALLAGGSEEGELPLAATLSPSPATPGQGRLTVQVEPGPALGPTLRATVAVARDPAEPLIVHRTLPRPRDEARTLSLSVPLTAGGDTPAVVVLEDPSSGLWGGTFASFEGREDRGAPEPALLPSPKPIHLLVPRELMVMGRTRFSTVVSSRSVRQVDFLLDGRPAATATTPPFTAELDLGPLPRTREVEVVARGADGRELGRDAVTVNGGSGSFRVRILEPRPSVDGKPGPLRVGRVTVEADVQRPGGAPLDRVEFYWKSKLVATRYAPPFRQQVTVPRDAPQGFIRVVARLADGSTAEDVVFLNSSGGSERLEVNLVQLFTVVTGRDGHPVEGLGADDFQVYEEGKAQRIASFSDARDLPLTVGLAIDSSASMFVKLPKVRRAAASFVDGLLARRDRAFLVRFGDEPQLTQPTTSRLPQVVKALQELRPEGETGIWKGIVYSLVQLQGAPGRKALILYSDGADEDRDFPYRTCLRFARRIGIPIYVILSNNEIVRTQGKGLAIRGFLHRVERLTQAVGGRVYLTRVGQDLESVYRQIDEELRSQYLLTYYSEAPHGGPWQRLRVEVDRPGVDIRTLEGFFP